MKNRVLHTDVRLDRQGVDEVSEAVRGWLDAAGADKTDTARTRILLETLLSAISERGEAPIEAKISFTRLFGTCVFQIRYGGERFDPMEPMDGEPGAFMETILANAGIRPAWHWRAGGNELLFRVPTRKHRAEFVMLACIAAAVVIGLLGRFLPEAVRSGVTDYVLTFLADGFLNLLSTFIGVMIFLTIIAGVCGIGSAAALGQIGKKMTFRFVLCTFLISGLMTLGVSFCFSLERGEGGGGAQFLAIQKMLFGILPRNPIQPFLDGNTLQIVFMAGLVGVILLFLGSETEGLRSLIFQLQAVVTRCVSVVCMLLPIYILVSLVAQFWSGGITIFLRFWKPLVLCLAFPAIDAAVYMLVICGRLRVKPSVLLAKLMPDCIIGLSTASSSAAFSTSMEINEKKLGIDASFSRMAWPVGCILCNGCFSLLYVLCAAFLAESFGLRVDIAWWVTVWIVCALLSMATPPVAGGTASCLSILMAQLSIPAEGLAAAVTLAMLLDFLCTGAHILILHMELILQADRMKLLDRDVLRSRG